MKKAVFAVLAVGFLGGLVFAQTPNDFKIDFTKEGDGLIITDYTGTDTMVVIPAEIEGMPVRGISLGTFNRNRNITEVVFPDGVTEIPDGRYGNNGGNGAFTGCSKLTAVTLPQGLTKIGEATFTNCTSLAIINIPNTVTEIGKGAFSGCSSLVSIIIPNSTKIFGWAAFAGCSKLVSVAISNSMTQIDGYVFSGCSGLNSITIPNSVTEIGYYAFNNSGLTAIALPVSVKSIGPGAFRNCNNLTTVALEEGTVIEFSSESFVGSKLDVKSQIALRKAGYTGSF